MDNGSSRIALHYNVLYKTCNAAIVALLTQCRLHGRKHHDVRNCKTKPETHMKRRLHLF